MNKKGYLIGGTFTILFLLVLVLILACIFTPTKAVYTSSDIDDTHYCIADGTMVTLANGSHVAVEDLKGTEELMVWDMMNGKYSSAPIFFVSKNPTKVYEIIELIFSDGTAVKVVDEHAFFDVDEQKYVFITNEAEKYVGHTFNKGNTNVKLLRVNIYDEYVTAYSLVTKGHLCYYANGLLSMPGNAEGLVNIFNIENMKYNEEMMSQDIKAYGVYSYEEFCNEVFNVPQEVFNSLNGQYLKISMKKDLTNAAELKALYNKYCSCFGTDPIPDVKLNTFEKIVNSIKSFFESMFELFK